ncbi:MAG: tripartite tricarboxylate transporter substrate binding protein [Betaproteobacteria bacterium]|nr:tripartite tricarboxylate transporter substrate binding protein [Betaproteobacteria bacterium]
MCQIPSRGGAIVAALFLVLCCGRAFAQATPAGAGQAYPVKPIRLIVPFPAGASTDIVGRMLGQKLFEQMGEQVVPDNRPGAGGNVGIGFTAKAPPDGYTVVIATSGIAISPSLYSNLAYDAIRDLTPIARLTSIPNVLIVHPSVPARTLRQFISLARAHPGKLNFGSGGVGTTNHLANELLKRLEKINMVHVPYKGVTQAMVAMTGGEVDEVIMPVASALTQIRAGKVRALAVLSDERTPVLPDVPTSKQAGVDNFTMPLWYGMFAPAGTPRDIVSKLSLEVVKALGTPDLRERLQASGVDPWPGTPEQMAQLLRTETARYAEIVRSAGLPRE